MSRGNTHIKIMQQIDAYLKGKLSSGEIDQLWKEFLRHPDYFEIMETEAALKAIYQEEEKENKNGQRAQKSSFINRKTHLFLAVAATVTLIITAWFFFRDQNRSSSKSLAINRIPVLEMESPPIFRSQNQDISRIDSLLNSGIRLIISGDTHRAGQIYHRVIERFPSSSGVVMAHLNMGIIRYNNNKYEKAVTSLNRVLELGHTNNFQREKAYWFLANAYLKMGKWKKAEETAALVKSMHGLYVKPAGELLKDIEKRLPEERKKKDPS